MPDPTPSYTMDQLAASALANSYGGTPASTGLTGDFTTTKTEAGGTAFNQTTQGYVDVMNAEKPPNNGTGENQYFNIDDPAFAGKWAGETGKVLSLDLPPLKPDLTDPCMSGCALKAKLRETNCAQLRARVEIALEKAGCPSIVSPKPVNTSCYRGLPYPPTYTTYYPAPIPAAPGCTTVSFFLYYICIVCVRMLSNLTFSVIYKRKRKPSALNLIMYLLVRYPWMLLQGYLVNLLLPMS